MKFRFTQHAKQKLARVRKAGFTLTLKQVKQAVLHPRRVEDREGGTLIATTPLDEDHVLRVVYRPEENRDDIIVIITFYPGRRKAYHL